MKRLRPVRRLFDLFTPKPPFPERAIAPAGWRAAFKAKPFATVRYALRLPGIARPLRVVFLADFHVGSQADDLERVPAIVAKLLAPLQAPLGVFSTLGNHDHEYGAAAVVAALNSIGIATLTNAVRLLPDIGLAVVGLDDERCGRVDVAKAFAEAGEGPKLVLAHDPASFSRVPAGPHVVLAGHTHAGQIVLPLVGPLLKASDGARHWMHGLIEEGGRRMIVTAGLGCSGPPIRYVTTAEIVVVELAP